MTEVSMYLRTHICTALSYRKGMRKHSSHLSSVCVCVCVCVCVYPHVRVCVVFHREGVAFRATGSKVVLQYTTQLCDDYWR